MADEKESPGSSAKKKKCKYYYYVSSQSDEADTLKDKFWRNLEEGKIDVMQTPDLYSKVKCNKKPPGLVVGGFGNVESPVSTFDRSPSSSCGSSAKSIATPFSISGYETGSLLSNSPLVDSPMHSPLRGTAPEFGPRLLGYDPHSTGNGAPEQNIWDDLDRNSSTSSTVIVSTWQSVDESNADNMPPSSLGLENSLGCSRLCDVSADTDDTLICEADVAEVALKGSRKKNPRCKRLATKRCRNKGYLSRRKVKHRLLHLSNLKVDATQDESAAGSERLLFTEEKNVQKSEILSPKKKHKRSLVWSDSSKNVRSKRKQYYVYVDVGSEEADTLKDKFWRNLEQGMMDFSETGDLYSKVKGSRKARPWASSSQISYDVEEASMESSSLLHQESEAGAEEAVVGQTSAGEPCQWLDEPRTLRVKKKILRMAEPLVLPTLTLPVAYVDLTKTLSSDRQENSETPEDLAPSDEKRDEIKPNPQKEPSEEELTESSSQAELSCVLHPVSSDSLDKKSQSSLPSPGVSQSTNDCKLLSTCEVAVKRLCTDKVAANEEIESIEPEEEDRSTEPRSVVETRSLQPEAAVVVSSVCKTSQEYASACVAATAKDEQQESDDCFGNIDFDPSSPLDDLCPSSDVEFSDILELAASVSRSAGGMTDLLTYSVTALDSDVASSKQEIPGSSSSPSCSLASESLRFTLKLYSEMKHSLLDPVNIFDGSWPEAFLSRWGGLLEEAFQQALVFKDQPMGVALLDVFPAKRPFDLEKCDSDRRTLLMRAADQGQFEVASALIGRGALPNSRDRRGNTPLMISAGKDDRSMAKLMLDSGARIDATNGKGETALMMAVGCGSVEVVELLLLRGANFSVTNSDHQTAMHLAKANHRNDIFELLNVHIGRLLQRFRTVIAQTLGGMAEVVCPLFPLQCFSLRDSTIFTVNFLNHSRSSSCPRSILFIGHTLIGEHNLHCALHGPSAVLRVTLNGKDLRAFSQEGMFLTCVDCVSNGSNELVIRTIRDEKSELKLLVCAYTVQPCGSTTNPTNPLGPS